jgi:hypothetical protein
MRAKRRKPVGFESTKECRLDCKQTDLRVNGFAFLAASFGVRQFVLTFRVTVNYSDLLKNTLGISAWKSLQVRIPGPKFFGASCTILGYLRNLERARLMCRLGHQNSICKLIPGQQRRNPPKNFRPKNFISSKQQQ